MTDDLLIYRLEELKTLLHDHTLTDAGNFAKIEVRLDNLVSQATLHANEITKLKVRASVWGAVGATAVMALGNGLQALGFHL